MAQKSLIVFTSMDQANKRLRAPVQILFTLTTNDPSFSPNSYPAVAWKILSFQQPGFTMAETLTWSTDIGFSVVKPHEDGTLAPGHLSAVVEPKNMVLLQDMDGVADFSEQRRRLDGHKIAAYNKSPIPHHLAICTVEGLDSQEVQPKFTPVIDLGKIKHSASIECGLPVMLQAYAVSRYKAGQVLRPGDLSRALFVDPAGDPAPLDIRDIPNNQAFRLYSHFSGRIILESV